MIISTRSSSKGVIFLPFVALVLGVLGISLFASYLQLLHAKALLSNVSSDLLGQKKIVLNDLVNLPETVIGASYSCLNTICVNKNPFADIEKLFQSEDCNQPIESLPPIGEINGAWSDTDCIEIHTTENHAFRTRGNLKLGIANSIDLNLLLVAGQTRIVQLTINGPRVTIFSGGDLTIEEVAVPKSYSLVLISPVSISVRKVTGGGELKIMAHESGHILPITPPAILLVRAIRPVAMRDLGY